MVNGSCLCAAVRWRVEGALDDMSHCHCCMCRKAHGAPFATQVVAAIESVRWMAGETLVRRYESSPGCERAFCAECGSVLPGQRRAGRVTLPAGCFDDDPGVRPQRHVFFASRVPWLRFDDDLPRFDARPGDAPDTISPNPPRPRVGQMLHGSCLCGDVAFEVIEPFRRIRNCHCTRCRKARAAAHTTNAFTGAAGVRFTRGAERVRIFRLPGARTFGHAFCERCGSGMPRVDAQRDVAVVALATLDDDPGMGPGDHIHVVSRAPWYTPADGLVQHPQSAPG